MNYAVRASSLLAVSCLALVGCATTKSSPDLPPTEPSVVIREVNIPVPVGCVSDKGKPDPVVPLSQTIPDEEWAVMPPGAKAQAVKAQAGKRLNYEDELAASTASCE